MTRLITEHERPLTHAALRHMVGPDTDLAHLEAAARAPDEVIHFQARQQLRKFQFGLAVNVIRAMLQEVLASAGARRSELQRKAGGSQYDDVPDVPN